MSHTRMDQDIDLALDDVPTVRREIRPAQRSVVISRTALGLAALSGAGVVAGGFTGRLTLESKALPLLFALFFILGFVAVVFAHRADTIDTPAILIDDQEV